MEENRLGPTRRASQRPALSCTECARRKIKCDKKTPCEPCRRRGRTQSCHQETWIPSGGDGDPAHIHVESPRRASFEDLQQEVLALKTQIAELQKLRPRIDKLEQAATFALIASTPHPSRPCTGVSATVSSAASSLNGRMKSGGDNDSAAEDAATTFEYLALGHMGSPPDGKNLSTPPIAPIPLNAVSPTSSGSLLKAQSDSIIEFALESIGWQHPVIHFPTFRAECQAYWAAVGGNRTPYLNRSWLALYLALLSVGVHHMSLKQAVSCGLIQEDTQRLPKLWFNDCIAALNRSDYLINYTLEAVQTIAILGFSAYDIAPAGLLNVLHGCAVRIAQNLQLHRLAADPPSMPSPQSRMERELGKRTWWALVSQDWFWLPHARMWTISPEHFTTPLPSNWRDDEFPSMNFKGLPMDDGGISMVMQQIIIGQVAAVLQNFFAKLMTDTQSLHEDTIAQADAELQRIVSGLPPALREVPDLTGPDRLPPYVAILRHYFQITCAHKRLVIHRAYLNYTAVHAPVNSSQKKSLRARVRESRVVCVAAARQIIRELAIIAAQEVRPTWSTPYHGVGAATLLMLDVLEREARGCIDDETLERRKELERGIEALEILSDWSAIAQRGVTLVRGLLRRELTLPNYDRHSASLREVSPRNISGRVKRSVDEISDSEANGRKKRMDCELSSAVAASQSPQDSSSSLAAADLAPDVSIGYDWYNFNTFSATAPTVSGPWAGDGEFSYAGQAPVDSIETLLNSSFGVTTPVEYGSYFAT